MTTQDDTAPRSAPLPIGIVACSAEGAALCYRTICAEAAVRLGPHAHPEVALHGHSLADYVACLERGDLQGVGALMGSSARKLVAGGARLLICPDNTIHAALPLIRASSPAPWLHIAEVVAEAAAARGAQRVGVLGTRWLVASEVYPAAFAARGIEAVRPGDAVRDDLSNRIMEELVHGVIRPSTVAAFQQAITGLKAAGCDAVALGCTEIPLIIDDTNSALPTLDSTRLLARAALAASLSAEGEEPGSRPWQG